MVVLDKALALSQLNNDIFLSLYEIEDIVLFLDDTWIYRMDDDIMS